MKRCAHGWRPLGATSTSVPALRPLLIAESVALVFFACGGPIQVAYAKTNSRGRRPGLRAARWRLGNRGHRGQRRLRPLRSGALVRLLLAGGTFAVGPRTSAFAPPPRSASHAWPP